MPFATPQYNGEEAARYFRNHSHDVTRESFMDKGEELSRKHSNDPYSQQKYLQGWLKAWPEENANSVQSILDEINKDLNSYEGDPEPFDAYIAEKKGEFHEKGLYLFYDPNANDMEGEYKVTPLAQLQS